MYTFKITYENGENKEYKHIIKVYYCNGINSYALIEDEIFNHAYSPYYDIHLYSEDNAYTITKNGISVIQVTKEQ